MRLSPLMMPQPDGVCGLCCRCHPSGMGINAWCAAIPAAGGGGGGGRGGNRQPAPGNRFGALADGHDERQQPRGSVDCMGARAERP